MFIFFYYTKLQNGAVAQHYLTPYPAEACLRTSSGKYGWIVKSKQILCELIQK